MTARTIEHSRDFRRVKKLVPQDWDINISSEFFYLIVVHDGVDVGIFEVHPYKDGLLIHLNMSEECRGKKAVRAGLGAFEWVFDNTDYETIYAVSPPKLRHAHFLANHVGMEYRRTDEAGFRHYEISRETAALNSEKVA